MKSFSVCRVSPSAIRSVATQSISSLKIHAAGESWRTLLQTFPNQSVFLSLSDDSPRRPQVALRARDRLKASYNFSESDMMRISAYSPQGRFPSGQPHRV